MKLISMFEKDGITYVIDDENNVYALQKVSQPSLCNCTKPEKNPNSIDIGLIKQISNMLEELNVPHYTSYEVLVHCIYFTIKDENCRNRLYVTLYPKVARLHNMMSGSVSGSFSTLITHWSRTKEYKQLFGKQTISSKKLILGLTDYYLKHNKKTV